MDALTPTLTNFIFLRPWWLLALLLLPLLWFAQRAAKRQRDVWQRAVDPHLLPHLIARQSQEASHGAGSLLLIGAALAILAMAGPSWRTLPAPLWQVESPLLIALDLSSAMQATDLPPSRLAQARSKIAQLLEQRRDGQVGLLVYSGDAFTVAPITRDGKTVRALLDSLSADLMPVDGQRADRAIDLAVRMLSAAAFSRGEILLLTDGVDDRAQEAARKALRAGFRVSALGVGTAGGAPIAGKEGFLTGADGQVQLARLDSASLQALAQVGDGSYATISVDDADLRMLGVLNASSADSERADDNAGLASGASDGGAQRVDDGYWLLLALLPLALAGFRRGWLAAFGGIAVAASLASMSLLPTPAMAADPPVASETAAVQTPAAPSGLEKFWDGLWQRDDQRARQALDAGQIEQARELAPDPALRASAAYRGEDYAAAAKDWAREDSADAHYNRGNALAKAGKLADAVKAYEQALAKSPDMADALANKLAVETLLKQQQQQKSQKDAASDDSKKGDSSKDQQSGKDQSSDSEQEQQPGQDQQQGDGSEPSESKDSPGKPAQGEQQSDEPGEGDQAPSEDEAAKPSEAGSEGEKESDSQKPEGEDKSSDSETPEGEGERPESEDPPGEDGKAPTSADAEAQRAAEEAARQEMQAALDQSQTEAAAEPSAVTAPVREETPEERAQAEQEQALQQWMRRVPDDPGGLLRRKFAREYQRRQEQGESP